MNKKAQMMFWPKLIVVAAVCLIVVVLNLANMNVIQVGFLEGDNISMYASISALVVSGLFLVTFMIDGLQK